MEKKESFNQLEHFCAALLKEAEDKKNEFLAKLDQTRATEIEKAETEVLEETYHTIQTNIEKIRSDAARRVSKLEYESRMELLKEREALVSRIFSQIEQRIRLFTQSSEYGLYLKEVCRKTAEIFNAPCDLLLRQEDMGYAEDLLKLFKPGSRAEVTPKIRHGGVLIRSEGRIFDQTLDQRLTDEKKEFAEKSGLVVN